MVAILKALNKVNNPGIFSFDQDIAFCFDVFNLVLLFHFLLFHLFHGKNFLGLAMPDDPDFSEGAAPNNTQQLVVFDACFFAPTLDIKNKMGITLSGSVRLPCAGCLV